MGKSIFKEYNVNLHGKQYIVLEPWSDQLDMWIELWATVPGGDWDYCMLGRKEFEFLRDSYIALTQNPHYIIYFPLHNAEKVTSFNYTQIQPDFVLYTHQSQLNRKEWTDIKRCMKYIKPKQRVISFHMPTLFKDFEKIMHQWKKKKTYYRYRGWKYRDEERIFYQYETCFLQSSIRQALSAAIDIQKALERDLETEMENHQYLDYTAGSKYGGISYEFATKEFLIRREAQGWKYMYSKEE